MKPRALAYPDLILFNGKIRSFAANNSIQEALACAGGRIVATGNQAPTSAAWLALTLNPSISRVERRSRAHGHPRSSVRKRHRGDGVDRLSGFLHRCSFHRRYSSSVSPNGQRRRQKVHGSLPMAAPRRTFG